VDRAADELFRAGQRPSVAKIRARVGGSPNTIAPMLDTWWSRLAARIDAGPDALARLPQPVALAAEALFIRALDAARERAEHEQSGTHEALTQEQQRLDARRHVLSLREADLEGRISDRDKMVQILQEAVRHERGIRRKLELAYEDLQARLRTLEAQQKSGNRRRIDRPARPPARTVPTRRSQAQTPRIPRKRSKPRPSGARRPRR
jgi:hypothetical protein